MQRYSAASFVFVCALVGAQQHDTLQSRNIQEVVIINTQKVSTKEAKPLTSIDEYLQKAARVSMIRRGAYAWEPTLNSMTTERTLITIDGMKIFGACTDKMDPVTSYVEVSNLSEAVISSGQEGACHGNTIGGAIDLKRIQSRFGDERWRLGLNSGFESVNTQTLFGLSGAYRNEKLYSDFSFMQRDAGNYFAGNHTEVPYSQYHKFNVSGTVGLRTGAEHLVEGSVIYDKATDVGYPALPMDVSLAEALITSVKFQHKPAQKWYQSLEVKAYYNTIIHRMDDTQRPNVIIHMDMPGWSRTAGYYAQLKSDVSKHQLFFNLNGYYNLSTAEMTMYPQNQAEPLMFMYTWPAVKTLYQNLYVQDELRLGENSQLKVAASVAYQQNKVTDDFGLNSLRIFYPELTDTKTRILKSFSANFKTGFGEWTFGSGAAYGDRAPSVSEGYGFYLFNSSEKYDYIGNPYLKNESSVELNVFIENKNSRRTSRLSASFFHLSDYIIGKIAPDVFPMTIGATGVKQYTALPHAQIFTLAWTSTVRVLSDFVLSTQLSYNRGTDDQNRNLPLISPLAYSASARYAANKVSAEVSVLGNTRQRNFAEEYGENSTAPYAVLNASAGYAFQVGKSNLALKAGIENIFDTYYTTFSDWNKIPRPGRNFFLNLTAEL